MLKRSAGPVASPGEILVALVVIFILERAFPSLSDGNIEAEEGSICSEFSSELMAKPWPEPSGRCSYQAPSILSQMSLCNLSLLCCAEIDSERDRQGNEWGP